MAWQRSAETGYRRPIFFYRLAMDHPDFFHASPPITTIAPPSGRLCHCLRWDAAGDRLWWADAAGDALHAWHERDGHGYRQALPDAPQLLACCASGRMLIGMSKRLCLAELRPGGRRQAPFVRTLAMIDAADQRTVIAGGRTDRAGNFVFGTRNLAPAPRAIGSFFQFSRQHGLRRLALPTVVQASAICFTGDGSRMFFADAPGGMLWQCDYDAARAAVGQVRPFAPPAAAGMTVHDALVDHDDHVWSLLVDANDGPLLACHDHRGGRRVLARLACGSATSLAFAGPGGERLLLLAREGSLREVTLPALRGLAEVPFDDRRYSKRELRFQPNPRPPGPR